MPRHSARWDRLRCFVGCSWTTRPRPPSTGIENIGGAKDRSVESHGLVQGVPYPQPCQRRQGNRILRRQRQPPRPPSPLEFPNKNKGQGESESLDLQPDERGARFPHAFSRKPLRN